MDSRPVIQRNMLSYAHQQSRFDLSMIVGVREHLCTHMYAMFRVNRHATWLCFSFGTEPLRI